jgi:hypothetical protein
MLSCRSLSARGLCSRQKAEVTLNRLGNARPIDRPGHGPHKSAEADLSEVESDVMLAGDARPTGRAAADLLRRDRFDDQPRIEWWSPSRRRCPRLLLGDRALLSLLIRLAE